MAIIVRGTKTYKLSKKEKLAAYEEVRREKWLHSLREAMENNAENLRFTDFFDETDFLYECMEEMERLQHEEDYSEQADAIVFNVAELNDIWEDDTDAE